MTRQFCSTPSSTMPVIVISADWVGWTGDFVSPGGGGEVGPGSLDGLWLDDTLPPGVGAPVFVPPPAQPASRPPVRTVPTSTASGRDRRVPMTVGRYRPPPGSV